MKTQLLCTFTTKEHLDDTVDSIQEAYTIVFNKIYVLQDENNVTDFLCTYNVEAKSGVDYNDVSGTISLHRKKHSNTLYTINALNELIKKLNGGVVDTKFPIEWQHYRNCILLTQHNEIKQLNTKIHKIIEL